MGLNIKLLPKNKIDYKILKSIIIKIILIAGIISLFFTIYYSVIDILTYNNALSVEATVKKVQFENETYILDIEYEIDNKLYQNTITYNKENVVMNDKIIVKYNKKNPLEIIYTYHLKEILISLLLSFIFLVTSLTHIISKKIKENKIKYFRENGVQILANIDGIFTDNNAKKKKGKLPYFIKASYVNPQDGETYTYKSQNYYHDLVTITSSKTISKIPIYLDPKNTSDYFIDFKYILEEEENE